MSQPSNPISYPGSTTPDPQFPVVRAYTNPVATVGTFHGIVFIVWVFHHLGCFGEIMLYSFLLQLLKRRGRARRFGLSLLRSEFPGWKNKGIGQDIEVYWNHLRKTRFSPAHRKSLLSFSPHRERAFFSPLSSFLRALPISRKSSSFLRFRSFRTKDFIEALTNGIDESGSLFPVGLAKPSKACALERTYPAKANRKQIVLSTRRWNGRKRVKSPDLH